MKERNGYAIESDSYKCIAVKSVTYAQKAKKILAEKGIDGYMHRGDNSKGQSCHWCIKVKIRDSDKAYRILLEANVPMTGESYEVR